MISCKICAGRKTISLPVYETDNDQNITLVEDALPRASFPCPQCQPQVPYRNVRALKVASTYQSREFAKYQVPIERGLAAKFGEFLMKEGLIQFSTDYTNDPTDAVGPTQITVTAHLGVVSRAATEKSGATEEVRFVEANRQLLTELERLRTKTKADAVRWGPATTPPWQQAVNEARAKAKAGARATAPTALLEEFDVETDNRFAQLDF